MMVIGYKTSSKSALTKNTLKHVQSNLLYVTFQGNIEMGHIRQVVANRFNYDEMHCEGKLKFR